MALHRRRQFHQMYKITFGRYFHLDLVIYSAYKNNLQTWELTILYPVHSFVPDTGRAAIDSSRHC